MIFPIEKDVIVEGLYRQDVYELPVSSIREIITNAVLHRSYVDPASIQVSIFDDRIEIDSPGMLCAGLSVMDALSGKSKCRNKALAEAFQYMNLIEGSCHYLKAASGSWRCRNPGLSRKECL